MGYQYFVQLDDDYYEFKYRRLGKGHRLSTSVEEEYHGWKMSSLDAVFDAFARAIETTPVSTIAFSQGGDHIGGEPRKERFKRKAMNSFVCSVDKPIRFRGRLNEDVTAYVSLGGTGTLFFTDMLVQLEQLATQANTGGMSGVYRESGTYVKSFYTVMAAPSCTTIRRMGPVNQRLHHHIDWNKAVPLIISQEFKKAVKV
jgi:predicted alpha/beta hydrolase